MISVLSCSQDGLAELCILCLVRSQARLELLSYVIVAALG
jgi:hypothetical protein